MQTLADQRCNLLIRENEKLTMQLTSVGEALARCHTKIRISNVTVKPK